MRTAHGERRAAQEGPFRTCARAVEHARRGLRATGGVVKVWDRGGSLLWTETVPKEIIP